MKKIIIMVVCAAGAVCTGAYAQAVNNIPPQDLRTLIPKVWEHVDKTPCTTGVLIDLGVPFNNPQIFSGQTTDSLCTRVKWLDMYNGLYYGRIPEQSAWIMPLADSVTAIADRLYKTGTITLGLLVANYNYIIKPDSNSTDTDTIPYYRVNNDVLYDNPNRTTNPYGQALLVAGAVLKNRSPMAKVNFVLPVDFLQYNLGTTITTQVDFGDGKGYQQVLPGISYPITYTSGGSKTIAFRVAYNGTIYTSTSQLLIQSTITEPKTTLGSGSTSSNSKEAAATPHSAPGAAFFYHAESADETLSYDNSFGSPVASILYGADSLTGIQHTGIVQPIILAEGFDPTNVYTFDGSFNGSYANSYGTSIYSLFELINNGKFSLNGFIETMLSKGYDIVIVDFSLHGGDKIEDNATVLTSFINQINTAKNNNGSTAPNVVGGVSMGAIVARYALRNMELNCQDHQTALYLSYDGPHQGANIPLGLQYLTNDAYLSTFGLAPGVQEPYDMLSSPAASELLLSYASAESSGAPSGASSNDHNTFYSTLATMGYPQNCRNIAVSLGALGSNALDPNSTSGIPSTPGIEILLTGGETQKLSISNIYLESSAHASSTSSSINVAHLHAYYQVILLNLSSKYLHFHIHASYTKDLIDIDHPFQAPQPFDYAPGSVLNTQLEVVQGLSGFVGYATTNGYDDHSMVPLVSSLDLTAGTDYFTTDPIVNNVNTPFDNTLIHKKSVLHDANMTDTAENFLTHEILSYANNSVGLNSILNTTYNFGAPLKGNINKSVTVDNGGDLYVNKYIHTGYSNQSVSNPNPSFNSTYTVNVGNSANGCPANLTIGNNGRLELGDATYGSEFVGNVIIDSLSTFHIENGGTLVVNDGSKLSIANGATFIFDPGATIQLNGDNAELEIIGNLNISQSAVFTFTGSGFLRLAMPFQSCGGDHPSWSCQKQITAGLSSEFKLIGTGRTHRMMELATTFGYTGSFKAITLENGMITGNSSTAGRFCTPDSLKVSNTDFFGPTLVVYGQKNANISTSTFESDISQGFSDGSGIGVLALNNYTVKDLFHTSARTDGLGAGTLVSTSQYAPNGHLVLNDCIFKYKMQGVSIWGGGTTLTSLNATTANAVPDLVDDNNLPIYYDGIAATGMALPVSINASSLKNTDYFQQRNNQGRGISIQGTPVGAVNIEGNTIQGYSDGLEADGDYTMNVKCNNLYGNYSASNTESSTPPATDGFGLSGKNGVTLNLSSTMIPGQVAGYNVFYVGGSQTSASSNFPNYTNINANAYDLYITGGYNNIDHLRGTDYYGIHAGGSTTAISGHLSAPQYLSTPLLDGNNNSYNTLNLPPVSNGNGPSEDYNLLTETTNSAISIDNTLSLASAACPSTGGGGCSVCPITPLCLSCIINTQSFPFTNITKAIATASNSIGTNPTTALNLYGEILGYTAPIIGQTSAYLAQVDVAYTEAQNALAAAYTSASYTAAQQIDASNTMLDIINNLLGKYVQYGSKFYYARLYKTVDKAGVYRLTGDRQSALNVLQSALSWAHNDDINYLNYQICLINAEITLLTSPQSPDAIQLLTPCKAYQLNTSGSRKEDLNAGADNTPVQAISSIIPNPNNGHFTVLFQLNEIVKDGVINIYDLTGRKVYTQTGVNNVMQDIDMSLLAKGAYFLKADINGQMFNNKIVIQ